MEYKIEKPVRLIELFAGIGAQSRALEYLGVNFEHYKICEIDKNAIKAYNAIHGTNFGVSDITILNGKDLEIVDKDKYEYILTYSFPCTSLSLAGKREGMEKGSETASSLLWEVERILSETPEKPQILVMENVTECHKGKNYKTFSEWLAFLRSLGYRNFFFDMNAKHYGIPQSRKRCFMISILDKTAFYYPPQPTGLIHFVNEFFEPEVDEEFFLDDEVSESLLQNVENDIVVIDDTYGFGETEPRTFSTICPTLRAAHADLKCVVCAMRGRPVENPSLRIAGLPTQQRLEINSNRVSNTITTVQKDNLLIVYDDYNSHVRGDQETVGTITTTIGNSAERNAQKLIDPINRRVRKFTPKEALRLMGFRDCDYEKVASCVAKTEIYKEAGNSIVVNCLVAIFGQLFAGKENIYKTLAKTLNFALQEADVTNE